jgi:riboflavin kinase/FMN adenylyltransferase
MQVIYSLQDYRRSAPLALTMGSFDGVHLAHSEVIDCLVKEARERECLASVMTFDPHPRLVLNKDPQLLRLLNTQEEKARKMEALGLDLLFVVPFDREFSNQTALEFLERLVLQLGVVHLVIGYNHRFGKDREGDFDFLLEQSKRLPFTVQEIGRHALDQMAVSSTKIRMSLEAGDVALAQMFLGYSYTLTGKVVHGDRVGRRLGYPTANLEIEDPQKLIPKSGIYAVHAQVDGTWFKSMAYIGPRPTLHPTGPSVVEVHVLDYKGDLYGKELCIRFLSRLRDDRKFESLEELQAQIRLDESKTRLYFDNP